MLISTKEFFHQFQVNYFDYKQFWLKNLLHNQPIDDVKEIFDYSETDYKNELKSDIRQTYFQAIETFFELFFVLIPNGNGEIHKNILEKITLSKFPYERIKKIVDNETLLDSLNNEMVYSDGTKVTLREYLFYFGMHAYPTYTEEVKHSIENIKKIIKIFAKTFSDRREYNSYKHGLRIIPHLSKLSIGDVKTGKLNIQWDLKDSMTFFDYDKHGNSVNYITKVFDPEKDILQTSICSWLIWLMVKLRDIFLNKIHGEYQIIFFKEGHVNDMQKSNVKIQDLIYSVKIGK